MPYQSLKMKPGIDVEKTMLLNEAGFSSGAAVRFRDGQAEKTGGFTALNVLQPLIGICTGMHAWADLTGNLYLAAGTDQRLELFFGGMLFDITPLRATTNPSPPAFTTQAGLTAVTVADTSNGATATDWVNILVPVSVGGIVLQGFYQVASITDANDYVINAAVPAVSNASGGAVPTFTTTNTLSTVVVTLDNHGYVVDGLFTVQVQTIVGGVTIPVGTYQVQAPVTTNTFTITPAGAATSTATVAENSGNARIEYLVPTGPQSAFYESTGGGYGVGPYGEGPYGVSTSGTVLVPLREWFLDNFGQDLVGNYTNSPLFAWVPPVAGGNIALAIDTTNFPSATNPPNQVVFSFVAGPQQMVICGGCDDPEIGGDPFDPLLLRWCDTGDFTQWTPTATNQAGSYRLPSGSRLVGGVWSPNFIAIWTDIDMWLMSYLGGTSLFELVWGFSKVAGAQGLLSSRACAVFRNLVFYLSSNGMYVFDGNRISLIPCSVWDKFWKNVNRQQIEKVSLQVNSYFQEIAISFPSATGNGTVDSRITYDIRDNLWTYDDAPSFLPRTAWTDQNVYGSPIGTDLSGYLQQQDTEGVYDANGLAFAAYVQTGWFSANEGSVVSFMERLEFDGIVLGGTQTIYVTVYAQDYATGSGPTGPVRTYGPFPWTAGSGPPWALVRARGRFFSVKFSSQDIGVFWRLGNIRYTISSAGRRP
jgi:hypothetical protein